MGSTISTYLTEIITDVASLCGEIDLQNTYTLDTTVVSFHFNTDSGYFEIQCNPSYGIMILSRNHPQFTQLYRKLKNGVTYNFTCSNWLFNLDEIEDITDCATYTIHTTVTDILNIQNEIPTFKHFEELVTTDDNSTRLLINKHMKTSVTPGLAYTIHYTKKFGDNFYMVTKLEN